MNLRNEEIVLFSMVAATLIMGILWWIKLEFYKVVYSRGVKRINHMKQLIKNDEIEMTLINVDAEPQRLKKPSDNKGLIIDEKVYTDKNAYFIEEQNRIYVVGKKDDFVIALMGGYIGRK